MAIDLDSYPTPGRLLRALLDDRRWTQRVLATVLGVEESVVGRLINDRSPVEAERAIALQEVFDVPAEKFLELQRNYDLAKARIVAAPNPRRAARARLFAELPIGEMAERGWLDVDNVRDVPKVEVALARFFGADLSGEVEILPHAAMKANAAAGVSPAQLAWLYRVNHIAREMIAPQYTPQTGRSAIKKLESLLLSPEEVRKVPRILTECGIRFVVVETLGSAKIDGVCFWLNESAPVIAMSLRHDRIDNFWFVLRHECEHVLRQHGRATVVVDADLERERAGTGPEVSEEERVANEAAADFCVPGRMLQQFIARKAPMFADRDILGFARTLNVHPGLVAGQLQHRLGRYDRFRAHLVKIKAILAPSAVVDGWGDIAPIGI